MKKTALIFCGLLLAPAAALAGPTCSPGRDNARILSAASPSAIHRSWQGGKQLGYGWSLQVERSTRDAAGTEYYVGDLYDPNGQLATRKIFAVESEWDCGP
ncbi:hypothetical protein ARD30_07360 [Bosea thiooxidans]|uniref:Uncharacterized protein n=1 Tax=Bosea thiooxidans TaxID=53254 RepID=A0A0Q3T3G9_9HYPH|nr:hypothetical protein [Bosea thiooxidans]KQK32194.1 hypothetical protein ARD30_07360 [Bosea thiooxidans]SKB37122.1 hypothetical protein SAMN05660750_00399 [Bosea thiooxidans]